MTSTVEWAASLAVDNFVHRFIDRFAVPGLALAIAHDGVPVHAMGYGYRDREQGLAVTPETVFGIASSTKSFTCMAILQLEEAGKLSVEDPVVRYLPEFRTPNPELTQQTTLHHFMTHSSGLPPLPSRFFVFARSMEGDPAAEVRPDWVSDHPPIDSYVELMEYIANAEFELLGPPGALFSYSNEGFALLGAIVERITGQSFDDFVQEHILDPVGMTHSTFDLKLLHTYPDVTTLYASREHDGATEVFPAPIWLDVPFWSAAGRLNSNVQDLLRYLEIFRTGGTVGGERILSEKNVQRMLTPYIQAGSPTTFYGYGLMITLDYHGVMLAGHGGGRKGISAHLCVAPRAGFTGAILANLQRVPVEKPIHAALNATLGLPLEVPAATYGEYTYPSEQLASYVGQYRSGEGVRVNVTVCEGDLFVEIGGKPCPTRLVGEHEFVVQQEHGEAYGRFLVDEVGKAYAVTCGSRIIQRALESAGDKP